MLNPILVEISNANLTSVILNFGEHRTISRARLELEFSVHEPHEYARRQPLLAGGFSIVLKHGSKNFLNKVAANALGWI